MFMGFLLIIIGSISLIVAFGFAREDRTGRDLAISACWAGFIWAMCLMSLAFRLMG